MPGDSPLGFRLPLGALPWVPPKEYPFIHPQDPSEPRAPLPTHERITQFFNEGGSSDEASANRQTRIEQVAAPGAVRTAMAIEPRDGVICVFMPPVEKLEEYLELIAAVEISGERSRVPGSNRGIPTASRSAPQCH